MTEKPSLTIESAKFRPLEDLDGVRSKALIVGVVGIVATIAGYFVAGPDVFWRGYLVGWIYWLGVALGMFTLMLINYLASGRYGIQLRRFQEAGTRTIPVMGLLGLPILFAGGMQHLYHWTEPGLAETDALLAAKDGYLNIPFFQARYFLFFAIWTTFAFIMTKMSHRHDETGDERIRVNLQRMSAAGLVTFILVGTFAVIDWIMSTDHHWYSSLYGPQFMLWQAISAVAFSIVLMVFVHTREPFKHIIQPTHFHDWGKLMLAFTMVWGYFSVSQFLIIWSGNLPEEVTWYLVRNTASWKTYTMALMFFAFFLPFAILLSQDIKFKPRVLMKVAILVLVVRWFDYYWQIAPNLHPDGFTLNPFDFAPWVGFGGLWVWLLLGGVRNRAALTVEDPVIKEAWVHG
jgi:hypothetical protein